MKEHAYYFSAVHFIDTVDKEYEPQQLGAQIEILRALSTDWGSADIVLIGCGEQRGAGLSATSFAPDAIRAALYDLYYWHTDVKIADAGNIILGSSLQDTYSALTTLLSELFESGKKVIILGGSHDLSLAQYAAYQKTKQLVNIANIDALIDLKEEETTTDKGFLFEMLTGKDNFVAHYTHLAFQSYLVNPVVLQTLDRLRFDCIRLGTIKENVENVEPDLRDINMLSIDVNALQQNEMPFQTLPSPNGLLLIEMCSLCKFATNNPKLSSVGFYAYQPEQDEQGIGAKAIAQNIWYLLDGWHAMHFEANLEDLNEFEIHEILHSMLDTVFLKSKRTGRWWMKLPNKKFIPCSYQDFKIAAANEIPERWLRSQERIV